MNIASETCVWTGGSPCESEQLYLCGSGRDWLAFFFFFSYFGGEHGKTDQGGDQVPAGSHHTENGLVCDRASWEL